MVKHSHPEVPLFYCGDERESWLPHLPVKRMILIKLIHRCIIQNLIWSIHCRRRVVINMHFLCKNGAMSSSHNDMVYHLINRCHIKNLFSSAQLVVEHAQSSEEDGTTNSCKGVDPTLIWLTYAWTYH